MIVPMPWAEDGLDPDDPHVTRTSFGFVGATPPDMAAHLHRLRSHASGRHVPSTTTRTTRSRAHALPPFRRPPADEQPTLIFDQDTWFLDQQDGPVTYGISEVAAYQTGIGFELVAKSASGADQAGQLLGDVVNLGHRLKTRSSTRIYLGVALSDGRVVTNRTCDARNAPDPTDQRTPWLYGGSSRSSQHETRATYFLSPLPAPDQPFTITISYPECGLNRPLHMTIRLDNLTG